MMNQSVPQAGTVSMKSEQQQPEVQRELTKLSDVANLLCSRIGDMSARLEPVLAPKENKDDPLDSKVGHPTNTNIGMAINASASLVSNCVRMIADMLDRLEI